MINAIEVTSLSKRYRINHLQARRASFREAMFSRLLSLGRGLPSREEALSQEDFWALKDVNFTLAPGRRLGIIGRNGAGKSTLLKILSRITEPTEGRVKINGRVSSLLEVGTGFHPELTGRENIFLNGTVLGMRTDEIRRKFDEIVAFAEVERFLDTPVKRYSSGMYVRLAFAVAAHLEPDILVIDEVLAVGDAQFQRKCTGKMKDVTGEGRTVLFVSHNMTTVTSLCDECLLLENGQTRGWGSTAEVTKLYMSGDEHRTASRLTFASPDARPGDEVVRLHSARLIDRGSHEDPVVRIDEPLGIEMVVEVFREELSLVPNFHVFRDGQYAFVSTPSNTPSMKRGFNQATAWIPAHLLNEGLHTIGLAVTSMNPVHIHFFEQDALSFEALDTLSNPQRNDYTQGFPGAVRPRLNWDFHNSGNKAPW